jgi:DNA-binding GntR family transcriptional regulator
MNIRKIRLQKSIKPNLGPKVADILRDAILQGELKPNERINETLISAKLRISKSPIREALRILESENLVQTHDRKGTFVKELTAKEIEELYMVLSLISRAAIRCATNFIKGNIERELKSLMNQMERNFESSDIRKNVLLARRFHSFIIKASENDLLLRIFDFLRIQEERCRFLTVTVASDDIAEAHSEHIEIAKALLKRNVEEAELLVKDHFTKGSQRALKALLEAGSASCTKLRK